MYQTSVYAAEVSVYFDVECDLHKPWPTQGPGICHVLRTHGGNSIRHTAAKTRDDGPQTTRHQYTISLGQVLSTTS